MHEQAWEWLTETLTPFNDGFPLKIVEFGSHDWNGSTRKLFTEPDNKYVGIDLVEGPGVDIVADAATWEPDDAYDLAICTELFEHTRKWPEIVHTAASALHKDGALVVTCAGPGRKVHSADGQRRLKPGEYYKNVAPARLKAIMETHGFYATVTYKPHDTYARGIKA